jgi:hypothetical protein
LWRVARYETEIWSMQKIATRLSFFPCGFFKDVFAAVGNFSRI